MKLNELHEKSKNGHEVWMKQGENKQVKPERVEDKFFIQHPSEF
jgi:hypothetical protein